MQTRYFFNHYLILAMHCGRFCFLSQTKELNSMKECTLYIFNQGGRSNIIFSKDPDPDQLEKNPDPNLNRNEEDFR